MNWSLRDTAAQKPGLFGVLMTMVLFAVGVAISQVVNPFASYYFYQGAFPDATETTTIFDHLQANVGGMLLSCVVGLGLMIFTVMFTRFGRYIGTFITQIEFIAGYLSLSFLSTYIMWKYNPTTNGYLLTILPFFIYQLAAFFILELAALLGQGGRKAYNFVVLGSILGAFIGIMRSIDQSYFVFNVPASSGIFGGASSASSADLGTAFGDSILDTLFFFSACALAAACIARSKVGGSFFWHLVALFLPVGLASAFGLYAKIGSFIPVIESTAGRYIVGSVIVLITAGLALGVTAPLRKNVPVASKRQQPQTVMGQVVGAPVRGVIVTGPVATNAVLMV